MRPSKSRFARLRGGALSAMAGLLLLTACEAKLPTTAEITSMDVASAEKAVAGSGAVSYERFTNADFFFNGVKVTREEATNIDAARIGTITVVKGGHRDTILVVTKDMMPALDSQKVAAPERRRGGTVTVGKGAGLMATAFRDSTAKPTIMIDGKVSTESALAALREDDIQSVSIMKPKQVVAGDPYPNGVIGVETKARQPARSKAPDPFASLEAESERRPRPEILYTLDGKAITPPSIRDLADPSKPANPSWSEDALPAIVIDGVQATRAQFQALDTRKIARIDVVKERSAAVALSTDPAAVNGVIKITTRPTTQAP